MPEKKSDKRKYEQAKPVSLHPLSFEEAVKALVKPKRRNRETTEERAGPEKPGGGGQD